MQTVLEYRTNRDLFSNHYLDEQLPETEAWNAADEAEVGKTYERLDRLYREQSDLVAEYDERQLRENLLDPAFELLGLTTGVEEPVGGERLRPDYALFGSERALEDAFERRGEDGRREDGRRENGSFYANALAVADAKPWGHSLDGRDERGFTNPSYRIHAYLDATGLDRAILTNGRRWRLYYGPTSHRLDSYYEIDLPALLETGDPEEFKYFYLFFRREAFLGEDGATAGSSRGGRTGTDAGGGRSDGRADALATSFGSDRPFVARVHRQSNVFAEELSEDLRENVYEALTVLADGFVAEADDLESDDLDVVYEACLTYLYRLIFVLYAESDGRDLLDTGNDVYRKRYSLNNLKRRVAEELDSPEPIYREWQTTLWDRLEELFTLVDSGSEAQGIPEEDLYIPAYNGGLFETDSDAAGDGSSRPATCGDADEAAAFLQSHAVSDAYLARVIELLTRRDATASDGDPIPSDGNSGPAGDDNSGPAGDDNSELAGDDNSKPAGDGRVFVDYSSLDVRHLGSIYEGLLEYDLEIADEPMAAVRDDGEQQWVPASEVGTASRGETANRGETASEVADESDFEVVERVESGDVYLTTETGKRKTTGSYYTPEFVVEYVVERTLDPLLDEIRADLDPADPSYAEAFAERVFDLSVLDPAMGSGHFLVKTVEYLARAVVQAQQEQRSQAQQEQMGQVPQEQMGQTSQDQVGRAGTQTGEVAASEEIADPRNVHWARRQVAKQCIYGVDENGMAVELAKVSLWLRTLAAEQPLAFLDHHLKRGDSLAGTDVETVEALARDTGQNASLAEFGATRADAIGDLMDAYREFVAIENETLSDVKEMERRYDEIRRDDLRRRLTAMANVHAAERFGLDVPSGAYERMGRSLDDDRAWEAVRETEWFREAQRLADERDFFHWKLAFPEVFYEGDGSPKDETGAGFDGTPEVGSEAGFDAVVGNPPYVRSRYLPDDLKEYYRREFRTAEGAYDLYVPFVELAADLGRRVSLVVPNKWTTTDYGRTLRDLLLDDHCLREVLDASNLDVFPDADIYPVVVTSERGEASGDEVDGATESEAPDDEADEASDDDTDEASGDAHEIRVRQPEDEDALPTAPTTTVSRSFVDRLGGRVVPLDLDAEFAEIAADVLTHCDRLGDHVTMSEGVHTGNVREKLLTDDLDAEGSNYRKVVGGDAVGRYRLDWDGTWLRYDESLVEREDGEYANLRDPDLFEGEKLLVRDISDRPVAVYDDEDHYALNTLYSVRPRPDSDLAPRYLLGVFNSAFVATYVRQVYGGTHVSGDYLRFKPMFAEEIPVPDPDPDPDPDSDFDSGSDSDPDSDSDSDSVAVEPPAVAREAGVECEVPADPEAAVATLTERRREVSDERADLNLDVLDYLPEPSANDSPAGWSASDAGPTLAEVGVPVEGVGDSVLAETASDREGLRIGEVFVDDEDGELVVSATARYKPGDEATDRETDRETDQWGYVETDPVPAIRFPDLGRASGDSGASGASMVASGDSMASGNSVASGRYGASMTSAETAETTAALVEAFVPAAAEYGKGIAGFRGTATKTNSLLDRLRALTLPSPEGVADEVARYLEVRDRAETLDERIEALDDAIDAIVYRLYGLDDEEIELVERLGERREER